MSDIPPIGPSRPAGPVRPGAGRAATHSFSITPGAPDSPAPLPPAAGPDSVSLATLLALQGEEEPLEDRAARRHGRNLLAELDALHLALLGRPEGFESFDRLATLLAHPPAPAQDVRLADAVAEITLRARVECARYTTRQ